MTKYLTFIEHNGKYNILYENGVYLGDIIQKEDGFYDWWPPFPSNGGCWSSYVLREIADKIDELNKPYEKELEDYFSDSR